MTAEAETTPTTAAGDAGREGRAGQDGGGGVMPEGEADLQLHIIADS